MAVRVLSTTTPDSRRRRSFSASKSETCTLRVSILTVGRRAACTAPPVLHRGRQVSPRFTKRVAAVRSGFLDARTLPCRRRLSSWGGDSSRLTVPRKKKATTSYWELLRDPRWQKARLKVMQLADFTCEDCGAKDKTLNVHHAYYEKDKAPWEYPTESLHCLCETCHKKWDAWRCNLRRLTGCAELADLPRIFAYAAGLQMSSFPDDRLRLGTITIAEGLAAAWGLTVDDILCNVPPGDDGETWVDGHILLRLRNEKEAANGR